LGITASPRPGLDPLDFLTHQPLGDIEDHLADDSVADPLEHAPRDLFDYVIAYRGGSAR
jgi:hypothetical protein